MTCNTPWNLRNFLIAAVSLVAITTGGVSLVSADDENADRIKPYAKNPRYWQYKGEPVLLLGGSKDDNLFQIPNLKKHLDELHAAGGNYIRNTMSDRPDHDFEVYAYRKLSGGKYDLKQWNDEYWRRFENLLKWTEKRDIIVQIEVWDRFDYSDHRGSVRWAKHPYNPKNNINYTTDESGLAESYTKHHPSKNEQPFFHTIPGTSRYQKRYDIVRRYQQRFVDKMLSHSLKYGHVLYCMNNETSSSPQWGVYWSKHIQMRARKAGVFVQTTDMWDRNHSKPKLWEDKLLLRTFDNTDVYSYIDLSQNNSQSGQLHWDNLQWALTHTSNKPRPINNVKIYGGPANRSYTATAEQAVRRFWRNIIGGAASSRFHRPDSGIGLTDEAKTHIQSMRLLVAELDVFRCRPDATSKRLANRNEGEAFLTFLTGKQYAVYFPDGGSVDLDLSGISGSFRMKWLDITGTKWTEPQAVQAGERLKLTAPGNGQWVVIIQKQDTDL